MQKNNKKMTQKYEHKIIFLKAYFSRLYEKNDKGKIAIPCFLKAKDTVQDLINHGLLNDVYEHITKRGLAC